MVIKTLSGSSCPNSQDSSALPTHFVINIVTKPLSASESEEKFHSAKSINQSSTDSPWILDYLGDGQVYIVDITKKSMKLFVPNTSNQAFQEQNSKIILNRLKTSLLGLDGEVTIIPIQPLNEFIRIWELKFTGHLFLHTSLTLIPNFVAMAINTTSDFHCALLFQKTGTTSHPYDEKYSIRIFFWCDFLAHPPPKDHYDEILQNLNSLRNSFNSCLKSRHNSPKTNLATISTLDTSVSYYYWDLINGLKDLTSLESSLEVTKRNFDFSFPSNLKIRSSYAYPLENIFLEEHIDIPSRLNLGTFVSNSQITSNPVTIPIDDLPRHMIVAGKPGFGKSSFLRILMDELATKQPHVGKLILGIGKSTQVNEYQGVVDQVFTYGDEMLLIPYLTLGIEKREFNIENYRSPVANREQLLRSAADMLVAGVGRGDPYNSIFHTVLKRVVAKRQIPSTLRLFFNAVVTDHTEAKHQYGANVQKNILRVLENRIDSLLTKEFIRTTAYRTFVPAWFNYWIQGKSIFLDLTPCSEAIKKFLVFLILNMIQSYLPEQKGHLHYVLLIDECHRVFSKSYSQGIHESDENNATQKMSQLMHEILTEYRSRGLAMIFADQNPSSLIPNVQMIPGIRILFNLNDSQSPTLFSTDPKEIRILQTLPKRHFLLINAADRFLGFTKKITDQGVSITNPPPILHPRTLWLWHYQKLLYQQPYYHPCFLQENTMKHLKNSFAYCLQHHYLFQAFSLVQSIWGTRLHFYLQKKSSGQKISATCLNHMIPNITILWGAKIALKEQFDRYVSLFNRLWSHCSNRHPKLTPKLVYQLYILAKKIITIILFMKPVGQQLEHSP
ncbi:hypothetical protein NEF87_002690 [Candidatus Lokiarchaeum ossiferum]|uniref:FtsK domain-containing protein n=1 Tax=Candidatus Lokiarchaeum ossiferum TaxID=2951803 RepID=A0ABY6HSC3_9ARCH|nr:hypothetical protein NEF87_002690 [Candidatus Lokiarchaeum sp. B-35]